MERKTNLRGNFVRKLRLSNAHFSSNCRLITQTEPYKKVQKIKKVQVCPKGPETICNPPMITNTQPPFRSSEGQHTGENVCRLHNTLHYQLDMKGASDCTIFIVQMFECFEQCYIKQTFKANCLRFYKYHVRHDTKQKSNFQSTLSKQTIMCPMILS